MPFQIVGDELVKFHGDVSDVVIPGSVTKIGRFAFLGCDKLQSINIPESVKQIGNGAFQACKSLEHIKLPANLENLGGSVFNGCKSLKEVHFSSELASIPSYAFCHCEHLERIVFPTDLKRIEWRAFFGCKTLQKIELPKKLDWIGEEAFAECTALTDISMPDGVTRIDAGAFSECTKLEQVKLPGRLGAVWGRTFSGTGLQQIQLPAMVKTLDFTAFANCRSLELIIIDSAVAQVVNYGNGDPATMPTNASLFFCTPRNLDPGLWRNMLRGYARMRLQSKTTPEQDRLYFAYIRSQIKRVLRLALDDEMLLQLLMEERLIAAEDLQEALEICGREKRHEMVFRLLDYRSRLGDFDPTKVFSLD